MKPSLALVEGAEPIRGAVTPLCLAVRVPLPDGFNLDGASRTIRFGLTDAEYPGPKLGKANHAELDQLMARLERRLAG
jgi:hypothetical protein